MRLVFTLGFAATSSLVVSAAFARDFRVNDIPNGAAFGCLNCHQTNDGKTFTPFGSDARCHLVGTGTTATQHVDWLNPNASGTCGPLYLRDSDGDGYTNGQELADPNGAWAGGGSPGGPHSNPGNPDSVLPPVCNNGKLDPKEECDGSLMSKTTCSEIQLGTGQLTCTPGCHYDTTDCSISGSGSGGDGSNGNSGCAVSVIENAGDRKTTMGDSGSGSSGSGGSSGGDSGSVLVGGLLGLAGIAHVRRRSSPGRR